MQKQANYHATWTALLVLALALTLPAVAAVPGVRDEDAETISVTIVIPPPPVPPEADFMDWHFWTVAEGLKAERVTMDQLPRHPPTTDLVVLSGSTLAIDELAADVLASYVERGGLLFMETRTRPWTESELAGIRRLTLKLGFDVDTVRSGETHPSNELLSVTRTPITSRLRGASLQTAGREQPCAAFPVAGSRAWPAFVWRWTDEPRSPLLIASLFGGHGQGRFVWVSWTSGQISEELAAQEAWQRTRVNAFRWLLGKPMVDVACWPEALSFAATIAVEARDYFHLDPVLRLLNELGMPSTLFVPAATAEAYRDLLAELAPLTLMGLHDALDNLTPPATMEERIQGLTEKRAILGEATGQTVNGILVPDNRHLAASHAAARAAGLAYTMTPTTAPRPTAHGAPLLAPVRLAVRDPSSWGEADLKDSEAVLAAALWEQERCDFLGGLYDVRLMNRHLAGAQALPTVRALVQRLTSRQAWRTDANTLCAWQRVLGGVVVNMGKNADGSMQALVSNHGSTSAKGLALLWYDSHLPGVPVIDPASAGLDDWRAALDAHGRVSRLGTVEPGKSITTSPPPAFLPPGRLALQAVEGGRLPPDTRGRLRAGAVIDLATPTARTTTEGDDTPAADAPLPVPANALATAPPAAPTLQPVSLPTRHTGALDTRLKGTATRVDDSTLRLDAAWPASPNTRTPLP